MPYIPSVSNLSASTPTILNLIKQDLFLQNNAYYGSAFPTALNTVESIRAVGKEHCRNQQTQNAFLTALMNRIGFEMTTSRLFENPWRDYKKGIMEMGETVQEIFVSMAKPYQFSEKTAETERNKRVIPDVNAMYHVLNFTKQYKQTIQESRLRQAFLSMDGVTKLISDIIQQMLSGANYDEWLMMKYLIARLALDGKIMAITTPAIAKANLEDIMATIKENASKLEYPDGTYNMAGVENFAMIEEQHVILTAGFEAKADVMVLSNTFNMEKADFLGKKTKTNSFGFTPKEIERLTYLFAESVDSDGKPVYAGTIFTSDELTLLQTVSSMITHKDFLMVYDNLIDQSMEYINQGRYWNHFLDTWKVFSASPFHQAVLFTTATPTITSVAISPPTATMAKNATVNLKAIIVSAGFANKDVIWDVDSVVSGVVDGVLYISPDETKTTLTVIAKSKFDGTKSGTATITIV